jgi:hypothetical protein
MTDAWTRLRWGARGAMQQLAPAVDLKALAKAAA